MTVTLLCALLITLITACSNQQIDTPKVIYVPQKCKATMPERPIIDNEHCGDDDKCAAVKTTSDYNDLRKYTRDLEATLKSCL